jgi:hypothetical protein
MKAPVFAILMFFSIYSFALQNETIIQGNVGKAKGVVFHDITGNGLYEPGKDMPLEGIAVSNGRDISITDWDGIYELPLKDNTAIFVIKPQNWMVPVDEKQLRRFYHIHSTEGAGGPRYRGLLPTGPLPESLNFPLYPVEEPDSFKVLVFGDTQVRNKQEVYYVARDALAELKNTDAVFGVTLGDNVFDGLDVLDPLIDGISTVGIPWIYVSGNHDIDLSADNNTDARGAWYRTFGPTYYSFSYGPAHFIVLDNIRWIVEDGERYYRTGLGADQMEFLRNELSRLDSGRLIVFLAHIPWTGSTAWQSEAEQQAFYEILASHPNSVSLVAHTHRHYHHFIDDEQGFPGDQPHHMISVATLCGAWWTGAPDEYGIPHAMAYDGTPTSYTFLHINDSEWKMSWKGSRKPADFQMQIYAPESVSVEEISDVIITANIFNALPSAKVQIRIGEDGEWMDMERVRRPDPIRRAIADREKELGDVPWIKLWGGASASEHIWEVKPGLRLEPGAYTIDVTARDDWWEYEGRNIIFVYSED